MDRRDFFEFLNFRNVNLTNKYKYLPLKKQKKLYSSFGLSKYIPSEKYPWDRFRVKHLLRRVCVGEQNRETVNYFLNITPSEAIDELFTFPKLPEKPTWSDEAITFPIDDEIISQRHGEFYQWAFSNAINDKTIRENIVNFFVNHFVVEIEKVYFPNFMVNYNQLFRKFSTGDFKELTKEVGKSPAMLMYLDGWENTKDIINENYARELQELFTIGIGNYSQNDITEAARAFTGWNIRFETVSSYFDYRNFDNGEKIFYGESGYFDGDDIVDIIFSKKETALFIAEKLYKHFIYYIPDENIVTQLADLIFENNFNLEIPLKILLNSEHFMDSIFFGSDIKSPLNLLSGAIRNLNLTNFDYRKFSNILYYYNQIPFNPPNVEGWKEHRKWINTSMLPKRLEIAYAIFYYLIETNNFNHLDFLSQYDSRYNAEPLINDIVEDFYPFEISNTTKDELLNILLNGNDLNSWNPDTSDKNQIIQFLIVIMQQPEFQLG